MKKILLALLISLTALAFAGCGGGTDDADTTQSDQETSGNEESYENAVAETQEKYDSAEDTAVSEMAAKGEFMFELEGFINKSYDKAFDANANEMMDRMMVTITLDGWKSGGTSIAFSSLEGPETGTIQLQKGKLQKIGISTDKYIFGSVSGTLTFTSISDEFVEGTMSNVVLEEESTFGAEPITIKKAAFKVAR